MNETNNLSAVEVIVDGQDDLLTQILEYRIHFESVLDIGLGSGYASSRFAEAGKNVTAIGFDVDNTLGTNATDIRKKINIFEDIDVCDMHQFDDGSFDAVWASHILEHVLNLESALSEIKRVIRDMI